MPTSIEEQVMLEAINRARANPGAEALRLSIDLNEGLNPGTIQDTPKPPVVHNQDLHDAATGHTAWMFANDTMSHENDGTPGERILAEGYNYSQFAENLGGYTTGAPSPKNTAALLMHDALFLDEGVAGRGHRRSILDKDLKEIGIGQGEGEFQGDNDTHLVTCDYATTFDGATHFLCGVVFQDSNQDGMYTGGEGMSGITITVKQGVTTIDSTTTGVAGDYTFALPAGDYTVIATLPTHGDVSEDFTIINENKKIDFRYDPTTTNKPSVVFGSDTDIIQVINEHTLKFIPINVESLPTQAVLYWSVTGAYVVKLNGVEVANAGTLVVKPETTTTYKLEAFGPAGIAKSEVVVESSVYPPFDISKNTFPEL
jgi:uncharacterized protein YkwD